MTRDVRPGIQVWVYPEELLFTEPEALAEQVAELGCDAASMSVIYHRARRVFPRHSSISVLSRSGVYFTPDDARYGALVPSATADRALQGKIRRFRDELVTRGLGFRAWLVALHDESLAREHPHAAARALDGSPLGHALCPSAAESVEYVASLARDVSEQLEPELIDLEAWHYPAWEPAYTLTLTLEPLSRRAELLAGQCFCASCRARIGVDAADLERLARDAAGYPFGDGAGDWGTVVQELAAARSAGARALATAVAGAVHAGGSTLRLLSSGDPEQARLVGVSPEAIEPADTVGLGCARLHGSEVLERFVELKELVAGPPRTLTVSTNWTPERTADSMAEDVAAIAGLGADGLSLYNLSLVPEAGLEAFRAASRAFRDAVETRA